MGSMVFTSKGGVRRGCTFANIHICQAVVGCIFLLLMCEIHIPWWLWVCGSDIEVIRGSSVCLRYWWLCQPQLLLQDRRRILRRCGDNPRSANLGVKGLRWEWQCSASMLGDSDAQVIFSRLAGFPKVNIEGSPPRGGASS